MSSFALIVLQSTMGGLQYGLVSRSYEIEGFGEVDILDFSPATAGEVVRELESMGIASHQEYEMEALARHENFISPVVVHGVDIGAPLHAHLQDFTFKMREPSRGEIAENAIFLYGHKKALTNQGESRSLALV